MPQDNETANILAGLITSITYERDVCKSTIGALERQIESTQRDIENHRREIEFHNARIDFLKSLIDRPGTHEPPKPPL